MELFLNGCTRIFVELVRCTKRTELITHVDKYKARVRKEKMVVGTETDGGKEEIGRSYLLCRCAGDRECITSFTRERLRRNVRVYDFKMDQQADAAPLSASIFDSSLRSAP